MMAIVNYRNEIELKSPVLNYMVSLFIIIIFFFIAPTVSSQVIEVSDSLKVDSLVYPNAKEIFTSDSLRSLQGNVASVDNGKSLEKTKKIPAKATLYTLILPGLGQTYNGNYWKVPIIYSLFAGIYFLYEDNNYKYNQFKQAYKHSLNNEPVGALFENYDRSALLERKDYYKRQRDFNIILGVLVWGLNILDANVDAHLMDYDISPDLSLNVKPEINNFLSDQNYSNKPSFGLKFVLSLH